MAGFYRRNQVAISRVCIVIVLIIIIRTSAEAFYYLSVNKTLNDMQLQLYIAGLLIAGVVSLALFLLYLWKKFDAVATLTLIAIIFLIGIKVYYSGWNI